MSTLYFVYYRTSVRGITLFYAGFNSESSSPYFTTDYAFACGYETLESANECAKDLKYYGYECSVSR